MPGAGRSIGCIAQLTSADLLGCPNGSTMFDDVQDFSVLAGEIVLAATRKGREPMPKISDLHRRWSKDADHEEAYDALGEEFDLARALIEARTAAGLSQSQLARRMKTSQSYIARIEGGQVRPSTDAF